VTEQEFQSRSEAALKDLYNRLSHAAEEHDFEADFNAGALAVEFEEPPGKFVVSPNSPVRQIWVSAHSTSFKFDWDEARGVFALRNESLAEMMARAISIQLGEPVKL
jgi:CyaY protein